MADIKQTQEKINELLDAAWLYADQWQVGSDRPVLSGVQLRDFSARLTAMEEALEKARKDVKFAMGTTGYPTVVRNYLDTILFDINQVLEGK